MLKLLLFVALAANILIIVSSTDKHGTSKGPSHSCEEEKHNGKPEPQKKTPHGCEDHHDKPKPIEHCEDNHHDKPKSHIGPDDHCDDDHHDKPKPHKGDDHCDDDNHGKPKPHKGPGDHCDDDHHDKPKPHKGGDHCDDDRHDKPKPHKGGDHCDDDHHDKPKPHKGSGDHCDDDHNDKPKPHKGGDHCDDGHHDKPKPHKGDDHCDDDHHDKPKPHKGGDHCDDDHHDKPKPHKGGDDCDDDNHGKPKPHKGGDHCDDDHHDKPKPHKGGDHCDDDHHDKPKPHKGSGDHCDDDHNDKPKPHKGGDHCDDDHHDKPKPHKGDDHCDDDHHDKPKPHKGGDHCDDDHNDKPKPHKGGDHCDDDHNDKPKPHKGGDHCDDDHHDKPKPHKGDDCEDDDHDKPPHKPADHCDDNDKCTGVNEYYDTCPPSCPPQTCDSIGKKYECPLQTAVCKPACRCIKDYYRDSEGKCVPEKECPCKQCKANEEYVECPDFTCEPKTCDELGFPQPCPEQSANATCPGKPACLCVSGYLRNKKGVCVPKLQCPSCGGDKNAQSGCGINCGRHCSNYQNKKPAICPRLCKVNSCDCKPDFVFDDNTGKCVAPKDCTPTCGDNEVFSNCTNGGCFGARTCSEKGKPEICVKLDPASCKKGCICEDGYLRDDDGVCIPEDQCQTCPECTEPNEEWDSCPPTCPPQTCDSIGKVYSCPAQSSDKSNCKGACRCKPGYYRNALQQCVCEADCKQCTGDNEYYDTCPPSCPPQTCDSIGKQYDCRRIQAAVCKPACRCIKDYYRDSEGNCVPEKECPCKQCKANEEYVDCPAFTCQPKTCDELGFPQPCPTQTANATCPVKPACLCVSGYLRNKKGVCVPSSECPSCGGDSNAQAGCGINCGRHCSNYKKKNQACILICKLNGCDCKPDFVFDDNTGKCVAPEDCTPTCGDNEVFSNCTNGGCFGARTCSEKGKPVRCAKFDKTTCIKGCICADGYLRNDDGVCIPEDQCPCTECTGPNEEYNPCPITCPPQTCEAINKIYHCPLKKTDCEGPGSCVCKSGYYRNALNQCISKTDCLKCSGPNEYFSCGGACDNVCATLSQQNQTNCPIVNIKCNEMCYCKEGYARAANKTCIPIEDCPSCPEGEIYNTCPPEKCDAEYCPSSRNSPKSCKSPKNCGEPRCTCGFNQKRDRKTGKCIAIKDCPPFKCDGPNEEYQSCPPVCPGQNCSDYINKSTCPKYKIGIAVPCTPQCRCKENFYRNADGVCVCASECVKKPTCTCGPHEEFSECDQECVCKKNYHRSKDGSCVQDDDCGCDDDDDHNCGVNEEYSTCTQAICRIQDCTQKGQSVACPRVKEGYCKKGCVCKENYLRAQNGTCVPEDQCDTCPDGETYNTCPPEKCDAEYCPSSRNSPTSCKSPKNCGKPRCLCGFNQKRDRKTGKCIAIRDCPPFKCDGPNEEYQSCPPVCPGQNCSDFINNSTCSKFGRIGIVVPCTPQCRCKENFYRNDNGVCVCSSECIKMTCGPHEEYSECDKKCVCKKNYYRAKDGTCVAEDDDCSCDDDDETNSKSGDSSSAASSASDASSSNSSGSKKSSSGASSGSASSSSGSSSKARGEDHSGSSKSKSRDSSSAASSSAATASSASSGSDSSNEDSKDCDKSSKSKSTDSSSADSSASASSSNSSGKKSSSGTSSGSASSSSGSSSKARGEDHSGSSKSKSRDSSSAASSSAATASSTSSSSDSSYADSTDCEENSKSKSTDSRDSSSADSSASSSSSSSNEESKDCDENTESQSEASSSSASRSDSSSSGSSGSAASRASASSSSSSSGSSEDYYCDE